MAEISVCCLLFDSERTRAGKLSDFFNHLEEIELAAKVQVEWVVLIDDRSTDRSMEIARQYSDPNLFTFSDFSSARNKLMKSANSEWVLMVEPDMRYNVGNTAQIIRDRENLGAYKCMEAWQCVHRPDEDPVRNLYYLLISPSLRYNGSIFETLKAYPHEILTLTTDIGDHFTGKRSARMQDAKIFYEQELDKLRGSNIRDDHIESYWAAMRYSELGLMDCLPKDEMDKVVVSLLQRATSLKGDFGPAYFELAKQHAYMGRIKEAREVASQGINKANYNLCIGFLRQFA